MKKSFYFMFVSWLCAGLISAQSLVEISKKEKERREQFKGKNVRVITNEDLKQMSKKPALATTVSTLPQGRNAEPGAPETFQESEAPAPAPSPEAIGAERGESSAAFATGVLPDTSLVENPDSALYMPDGKWAEIAVGGTLDLDFRATNGPGDDIAIYARWPGAREGMPKNAEGGVPLSAWPTGMTSYGVLVMGESGDWQAIGRGAGAISPETFDLGDIPSIKKIRIIFKPDSNPASFFNSEMLGPNEYTIGIDAVLALN
jgi:hypothetical protein